MFTGMLVVTTFTGLLPASADFLQGLRFKPEDGGDMFLRNVGLLSSAYTALYLRIENSSFKRQTNGTAL
jgi:hypothetical protein